MKKLLIIIGVVLVGLFVWLVFLPQKNVSDELKHKSDLVWDQSTLQKQPSVVAAFSNAVPQTKERFAILEKAGQLPENDHDIKDWQLAQHTTWWGKPLDPKKFWKGRVLWNDAKATSDAQQHGRLYPPMPYEDTNLPPYPNDEGIDETFSPDGPNISYAESSKEGGFWDKFDRTHPRPPDQIEHEQELKADRFPKKIYVEVINRMIQDNYPAEAFTSNALFWTYVQMKRTEYQKMVSDGFSSNDLWFQGVMNNLIVDPKLITKPLTPDQNKAANAWKVAYLQRLRRENADEQYIQGYMQAWNLSSNEVFGSGN